VDSPAPGRVPIPRSGWRPLIADQVSVATTATPAGMANKAFTAGTARALSALSFQAVAEAVRACHHGVSMPVQVQSRPNMAPAGRDWPGCRYGLKPLRSP